MFDIGECGVGCGDPNFGGVDRAVAPLISDASLMVGNESDGCRRECADDEPSTPPPERQLLEYWNEAAEADALAAALAESGDVEVSCTRPPSGPTRPPRVASPIWPIGAPVSCKWPRPAECCRSGDGSASGPERRLKVVGTREKLVIPVLYSSRRAPAKLERRELI